VLCPASFDSFIPPQTLSTFNRQLCCALAASGSEVVCLAISASDEEVSHARVRDVTLIAATRAYGMPESQSLARLPATIPHGFVPDFVIGHGRVTGPAAQVLGEDHFRQARRLHVVHMAPDEIEWHKLDRADDAGARAEERTQVELELGRGAFRVIAVGPRLHARYLRDLSAYPEVPQPILFNPGFDVEAEDIRQPPPGAPWKVLMLGRAEDARLKGLDIAASALGNVCRNRGGNLPPLELVVRGAPPDTSEGLRDKLTEWAALPGLRIVVRPYTAATETLVHDIRTASLMLMPSRDEGFGLVGLEAIVSGTPALISGNSGLGDLLKQTLEPEQVGRVVVEMTGTESDISERWARSAEGTLRDREAAFERARELQILLGGRVTWQSSVAGMLASIS
jgi:glycosyltransferase involved in cell wall biosynthesis